MATTPTVSPAPWSHAITTSEHGPLVSIATAVAMAGMVLFLIIRIGIRWPWTQLFGWDDAATLVGSLLAIGQSVASFKAVYYGIGNHEETLTSSQFRTMEKAIYAGDILFVLSLTASKLAVACLLSRLSAARSTIHASYGLMGLIGGWGIASVLAVAIRPKFTTPWDLDARNASYVMDVWTGVGATSVLTEIVFVIFPVFLLWTLQMPLRSKLTVMAGFGFRVSVAVVAILRIVAFRTTLASTADLSWRYVDLAIYTAIEMYVSLIAATIPCMHVFLNQLNTGYLGTTADQVEITATMAATKGSNSYALSTMRSRHTQNSDKATETSKSGDLRLRPGDGVNTSAVMHRERNGDNTDAASVDSDGSDRIMVRHTVQIDWGRQGSH